MCTCCVGLSTKAATERWARGLQRDPNRHRFSPSAGFACEARAARRKRPRPPRTAAPPYGDHQDRCHTAASARPRTPVGRHTNAASSSLGKDARPNRRLVSKRPGANPLPIPPAPARSNIYIGDHDMEGQCQGLCDSKRHWWLMPRAGPSSCCSVPRTLGLVVLPGMLCEVHLRMFRTFRMPH